LYSTLALNPQVFVSMSTERSDRLYFSWRDAQDKFDYFVAGVSFALVAYLVPQLDAEHSAISSAAWIETAALASLLFGAYAGLKRLEATVTALGVNYDRLRAQESAGALSAAAISGSMVINRSTGEVMSSVSAFQRAASRFSAAESVNPQLDRWARKAERWYKLRNWGVMLGLGLLILARVLPAIVELFGVEQP
jgi:hypothetical protein